MSAVEKLRINPTEMRSANIAKVFQSQRQLDKLVELVNSKAATAELEQPQPATAVKPRRIQRPPRIAKPRSEAPRPSHSRMRIAIGAVKAGPSAKAVAWTAAASPPLQSPPMLLSG